MKKYYSATTAKNKLGSILKDVAELKYTAVIKKNNAPIVEIKPIKEKNNNKKNRLDILKSTFGSMPDFPDVTKERISRKEDIVI